MNDIIIGIDLGTTNSEVAWVENGQASVITDQGKKILPSVVGVDDQGNILIGETARNQYLLYPERTVKSIKRLMGQDTQVNMAGKMYQPQEISAMILKRLKAIAEQHLGHSVSKAVITVPAYFSDAQRQATREAGEIAGLDVVRMINEPTAAALVYGAGQTEAKRMLVYDLGGGTFDVSVVNIQDGVVEVLSSHGDNHLGGDDFDQQIINHIASHVKTEYGLNIAGDTKAMARITRAAERAKIELSNQPFVRIEEEYLTEQDGNPVHLSLELARSDYETLIEHFIDATLDAVHIALQGAQLTATDIDDIILVGGSTRTPCIRERLFDQFGFEPHGEVDPDLCVALGAATQAAMIQGISVDTVLVDVTPYTYGTSALGYLDGEMSPYRFVPIIHKNSVLPTRHSEAFQTVYDGQETVIIKIFQGEDPDALNNIEIGAFTVENLKDVPAGNTITLTLELDLNGLLKVSAREKATGLEKTVTIDNAIARFEQEQLSDARQRVSDLFGEAAADESEATAPESERIKAARLAIAKAESLFDQVTLEDREDLSDMIETLTDLIAHDDEAALVEPLEQLNDMLYYLDH
ncbi:MAG: Hsp70 family protein [Methylococcales bacterium]|nr:Hsp70 family protein [Methylococcales bacterium]